MIDTIAHLLLIFGNLAFIIPILLIGFIWIDRRLFFEASCLLLFSISVNVALKVTFQIPLAKELGIPGFAFPSGHMQLATVFYAGLLSIGNARAVTTIPSRPLVALGMTGEQLSFSLKIILATILSSLGWSLIYCGYHTGYDVAGGVVTALLLIKFYKYFLDNFAKITSWIILAFATLTTLYSWIRYPSLPMHALLAYCGLIVLESFDIIWPINNIKKMEGSYDTGTNG